MIYGANEGNNIKIKRLCKEDIEDIIPLRIALQKFEFKDNLGIDENILINKTREFLNENLNKDLFMYGVYTNKELVSICGLNILKYFPQANDLSCKVGYIASVYTKEKYRQKGYQKKIFEKCIELGKEFGITRFKLGVVNPIAMKMYESFGFVDDKNAKKMKVEQDVTTQP